MLEVEALLGRDLQWLLNALEACGDVVEQEGLATDRGLPMVTLAPSATFANKDMRVYRAHCRELCTRYKKRKRLTDLDRVTDAELLLGLSQAALLAPLTPTGLACYSRLFRQVFGDDAVPELGEYGEREKWDGQVDEELATARRRKVVRLRAPVETLEVDAAALDAMSQAQNDAELRYQEQVDADRVASTLVRDE